MWNLVDGGGGKPFMQNRQAPSKMAAMRETPGGQATGR